MRIEAYFQQIRNLVDACPVVQSSSLTYDKRSIHEGFIRGEIYLLDASVLHLREFVDVEITVERLLYAYHYMDARQQLRFRYDNTGHHNAPNGEPRLANNTHQAPLLEYPTAIVLLGQKSL